MDDKTIHNEIEKLKNKVRRYSIVIILGGALLIFGVAAFIFTRGNSNPDIKKLRSENKRLELQMDSLNKRYTKDSVLRVQEKKQGDYDREQRDIVLKQVQYLSSQLNKFKHQYEKVSNYKNVPADSVVRLFHERFNYQ